MSGVNERTSHSPDDKVKLSCKEMVPHLGGRLSKLLFSNSKSVFFLNAETRRRVSQM